MIEALQEISYDSRPAVLVVAGRRSAEICTLLECAGARPAQIISPQSLVGVERGGLYDAAYCVLDDCMDATQADLVLGWLNSAAVMGGMPSIIEISRPDIDRAVAIAGHEDVTLLCDPQAGDRLAALAIALRPQSARLQDVSNDIGTTRLARLSEEVGRIARTLATMAEVNGPNPLAVHAVTEPPGLPNQLFLGDDVELGARIREMIRGRRARDLFFPAEMFADPVWDMLLDLMAARCERQRVSVSSLCIAASVPATTALRWLKSMTSAGLVVRKSDVTDGRRIFIELSDNAANAMRAYFSRYPAAST